MTNFCSDNTAGASPQILEALARAAAGKVMPYGNDDLTRRVEARLREVFETDCAVFPVATGTAANVLGLSVMTPPYGAVYCHKDSHINVDECGAPEFFTGGAKLVTLDGAHGKLTPEILAGAIGGVGDVHHVQPAAISLTQASEAGTLYTPEEIAAIGDLARQHGLGLQMDGARFANALVALGCSPAEITWRAGVDALAFGATKNGALAAEAVVLFKPELARTFAYRRKRGGHLFSKMRFLSAQLDAYLADDLWLANARHANARAARLAEGLADLPGARLLHPVEANEIFAVLPGPVIEGLLAEGFQFYRWGPEAESGAESAVRLVTAFDTASEDVDAFLAAARRFAADGRKTA
ncbi:MAG: low specificity L-threonine aldolase [Rhodospirillales bacterium]|nr:low specificity L-threonine aldolase [Rhodospirillales bacterium]MDH3966750.1 low specificity L-threonine aldolase [Rhodospirillales bacterium]